MGTANQKSTIDTHTHTHTHTQEKAIQNNTKDNQITKEETERGKEEKRPTKPNPKQLRKWQ